MLFRSRSTTTTPAKSPLSTTNCAGAAPPDGEQHRPLVRRDGDYEDFLEATDGGVREKTVVKKAAPPRKPKGPRTVTPEERRVKELEAEITAKEETIAALEAELADASVRADHQLLSQTARAHSQRQEELAMLMREWEAAATAAANG